MAEPSWPIHPLKVSSLNNVTLGTGFQTYGFWGTLSNHYKLFVEGSKISLQNKETEALGNERFSTERLLALKLHMHLLSAEGSCWPQIRSKEHVSTLERQLLLGGRETSHTDQRQISAPHSSNSMVSTTNLKSLILFLSRGQRRNAQ